MKYFVRLLRSLLRFHPSIHPFVRPTALMVFAHPKPEPEIDGLKMECATATAAAIVTCMHAATWSQQIPLISERQKYSRSPCVINNQAAWHALFWIGTLSLTWYGMLNGSGYSGFITDSHLNQGAKDCRYVENSFACSFNKLDTCKGKFTKIPIDAVPAFQ